MKVFFALIFLSLVVSGTRDAGEYLQLWSQFKQTYPTKLYSTIEEESNRFQIFISNVDRIDQLNNERNPRTYFGINHFADMTHHEIMAYFNHPDFKGNHRSDVAEVTEDISNYVKKTIPDYVDWREKGAVTPIADQGPCGSSPYWSAIVSMEGAWAIAGHPLTNLSVQQINDCSSSSGNYGCGGGEMTYSFEYILNIGGSESAEDYPYTGNDGTCLFNAQKIKAKFSSYKEITAGDEMAFTEALAMGPVASAVYAADDGFEFYQSGIYDTPTCNRGPCHGIGVVGYGTNDQGDYYILKNTWGTSWGMNGYMYMARNKGNMCSIASFGTYIIV